MTVSRRKFLAATGAALAAPAIARPAFAQAQVTLKLHHFLPPVSNGHAKLLAPWAKMVEAELGRQAQDRHLPVHAARRHAAAALRPGARRRRRHRLDAARIDRRAASRRPRCSSCRSSARAAASSMRRRRRSIADANLAKETSRHQAAELLVARPWPDPRQQGRCKTMDDLKGLKLRSPNAARRRGPEGARRHGRPHADPAGAREPRAARDRRRGGAVGGGAGDQAARAGEVPHRDPGLADALYGELLPGHEQGQVRRPAGGPQGGASTRTPAWRSPSWPATCGTTPARGRLEMVKKRGNTIITISRGREGQVGEGHRAGDRRLDQAGRRTRASTAAS